MLRAGSKCKVEVSTPASRPRNFVNSHFSASHTYKSFLQLKVRKCETSKKKFKKKKEEKTHTRSKKAIRIFDFPDSYLEIAHCSRERIDISADFPAKTFHPRSFVTFWKEKLEFYYFGHWELFLSRIGHLTALARRLLHWSFWRASSCACLENFPPAARFRPDPPDTWNESPATCSAESSGISGATCHRSSQWETRLRRWASDSSCTWIGNC